MAVGERVESRLEAAVEAAMGLRRPVAVEVSPDGSLVAATVTASFARKGERVESRIWIAPTGRGSDPWELPRGEGQDAMPRWAPSGGELAFTSDRDHPGRMSLYRIRIGSESVEALGDVAGSVEDARWAPDGRSLLVLAADLGADRAGAQTATRILEQGAEDEDPKVTRPSRAWRRLYLVDAATGDTREVGPEGLNVWEFDWRGDAALAVCSDDPSESAWYDARVALLDLERPTARTLYEPEWQVEGPKLSPDGARTAFLEGFCSDRGVLAGTVRVLELATGEVRSVAPDLDVGVVAWLDDSTLVYAAWRGLGSSCGTLRLDGVLDERLAGPFTLGTRHSPQVAASADGATLVSVLDGPEAPPEVVVLDGAGARPITALNAGPAPTLPRPEWERFAWNAEDGLEIEGLLALPRRRVEPLPLVVLVHGGPTSCWSWELAPYRGLPNLLADSGYAVLLPNPRGSAGRGQAFVRAVLGDMGGADLRDVLGGVDALVEAGRVDDARVAIVGGSYGGFMSAWAITQTDRFAAAVPQAVVSDWTSFHLTTNIGRFDALFLDSDPYDPAGEYPRRSPVMHARRCRTPTLIMHGAEDLCTPLGQAEELYNALVEAGCEVELVVYPREGHGWLEWDHQIDSWRRIHAWLDRHLNGK